MAGHQIIGTVLQEGYSTRMPPYFNSQYYSHWKERMKAYAQSIDYRAWLVIQNGSRPIPNNSDGKKLVQRESIFDYTKEELDIMQTNARAINMLYCAISEEEYEKISTCETAKSIWDRLENIHRDANKVKEIESTSTLEESKNGENREDVAVIPRTRKRKSRKKQNRKSQSIQNHQKNWKNEVQQQDNICCYKCGKPGHMKLKCPSLKKKNHRISTWSDEDESEEENYHERMENQCFMAMGETNKVCHTPITYCDNCDELQDDIELVFKDFKKVLNEYHKLRKEKKNWEIQLEEYKKLTHEKKDWEIQLEEYKKLTHEKKDWEIQLEEYNKLRNEKNEWDIQLKEYLVENNLLQEENFKLRKQISSLHKSPSHCFDRSKSSPWLNNYKSTEKGSTGKRPALNKLTEESSKSTNKATASKHSYITCHYCGNSGHKVFACNYAKSYVRSKYVWRSKQLHASRIIQSTNHEGPKKI
ncbi:PREDICTED: uncharacterized protein LOC109216741 [Nicotiana attenuata]|uniref:uncharacterized protein LOC109216741 n=1 Tax=Nicotiana attenuata TaxID=49451 RepID=UPI000905A929|nr:PREDICTED: uncharacterized protein LOC109216741 [Nicotiana attenuata]